MKKIANILSVGIAPVLTWLFPVVFLYCQNVKEVAIAEVFQPAKTLVICGFVATLIGCLVYRNWKVAFLFSAISGMLLTNFQMVLELVQSVLPALRYWHVLYFFVLVSLGICLLIKKFHLVEEGLFVAKIIFGGLVIFNLLIATPTIIRRISDAKMAQVQLNQVENYQQGKRNIYYLLCDEYAGFAQLQEEFGFDNAEFREQLQKLRFNFSETSKNESASTTVVLANLMQLSYVATEDSTSVELENLIQNGQLKQIMLENGYRLRGIGDTGWLGIDGTLTDESGATTDDGVNLTDLILTNSFLRPFIKKSRVLEAEAIYDSLDAINRFEIVPDSSTFTFFYLCYPHHPYFLDENGNMNPESKWMNDTTGKNNDAYVSAVKYVNNKLLPAITRIIKQDPNAIIVLCSDHGNRFGPITGKYTNSILNVMYYGAEEIPEIEGLSSVNTMRFILNREFGADMQYVDLPAEE